MAEPRRRGSFPSCGVAVVAFAAPLMFLTHVAFAQARAASGARAWSSPPPFDGAGPPRPLAPSLEAVADVRAPRPEAVGAPQSARAERGLAAPAPPAPLAPPTAPPPAPPPPAPPPPAARRPNVLVFYTDDVGCDWISAYRSEPACAGGGPATPHVDAIAAHADGFRFRAFWSEPMCTPSRVQARARERSLFSQNVPSLMRARRRARSCSRASTRGARAG